MNVISVQEIKRRGIAAVTHGPVHVIRNNRPQYVVLPEERYQELVEAQEEFALARIKASLEDAKAGRVTRHASVDALLAHLNSAPDA